jgi:histidine phosphotransferase ChpT
LNLVLLANAAVPRGGSIKVVIEGDATTPRFTIRSSGPSARIPPAFEKLVPGEIGDVTVDAQAVQAYYAGALARACRMSVSATLDGSDVVIDASRAA